MPKKVYQTHGHTDIHTHTHRHNNTHTHTLTNIYEGKKQRKSSGIKYLLH